MVKKLEWIEMAQLAVSSILFSKRNAWQSSSYWERLRCGEPCSNICCITMKRGTIRAKAIGSCFLCRRRQEGTREQCGVENDWRPAEVLREASGIKSMGQRAMGSQ